MSEAGRNQTTDNSAGSAAKPALPKADLHLHQEWWPRLDRVIARRQGRDPYDWQAWSRSLVETTPPGAARLAALDSGFSLVESYFQLRRGGVPHGPPQHDVDAADFVQRVAETLEDAAREGAVLAEVRFGGETIFTPDFMPLFREAEGLVQRRFPQFAAEAIYTLLLWYEPERLEKVFAACLLGAKAGLSGLDLLYAPYDREADWDEARSLARRAAEAGLGLTVHAGEFSTANIEAALSLQGVSRLGHAVHAVDDPRLLDLVRRRGVTVECCLTSNVMLGAVGSYAEHPLPRLVAAGIPVALATDNPVRIPTSIGREYALASSLGCSEQDLLGFTRNAVRASFASPSRKAALLEQINRSAGVAAGPER